MSNNATYFKITWKNPKDHRSYTVVKGNRFGIITADFGRPWKRYFITPSSDWKAIEPIVLRVTNDRLQPKDYASIPAQNIK